MNQLKEPYPVDNHGEIDGLWGESIVLFADRPHGAFLQNGVLRDHRAKIKIQIQFLRFFKVREGRDSSHAGVLSPSVIPLIEHSRCR